MNIFMTSDVVMIFKMDLQRFKHPCSSAHSYTHVQLVQTANFPNLQKLNIDLFFVSLSNGSCCSSRIPSTTKRISDFNSLIISLKADIYGIAWNKKQPKKNNRVALGQKKRWTPLASGRLKSCSSLDRMLIGLRSFVLCKSLTSGCKVVQLM